MSTEEDVCLNSIDSVDKTVVAVEIIFRRQRARESNNIPLIQSCE